MAMASGSDVAAQISDLVLMNSDFSSMPSVVAEGRRVINNIERAASLYLVKNIFSLILAVISITAAFSYPLTPSQLTLMSLLAIGIPSLILALEPNENLVQGKFLRNAILRALPAAFTDLFIIIFVLLFQQAFQINNNEISTITALLVTIVGFFMLWKVAKPVNKLHVGMMAGLIAALVFIVLFLPGLFSLSPLSFGGYLILILFTLLIPSVIWLLNKALEGLLLLLQKAEGAASALPEHHNERRAPLPTPQKTGPLTGPVFCDYIVGNRRIEARASSLGLGLLRLCSTDQLGSVQGDHQLLVGGDHEGSCWGSRRWR